MELLTLWIWNHAWVVPALCDAVALSCAVGTIGLMRRPAVTQAETPEPVKQNVAAVEQAPVESPGQGTSVRHESPQRSKRTPAVSRISEEMLTPLPQSKSVTKALAALNRWEATYRPHGQGLDELSALAARRRDLPVVHKANR
jgi:hypothetical protein